MVSILLGGKVRVKLNCSVRGIAIYSLYIYRRGCVLIKCSDHIVLDKSKLTARQGLSLDHSFSSSALSSSICCIVKKWSSLLFATVIDNFYVVVLMLTPFQSCTY